MRGVQWSMQFQSPAAFGVWLPGCRTKGVGVLTGLIETGKCVGSSLRCGRTWSTVCLHHRSVGRKLVVMLS